MGVSERIKEIEAEMFRTQKNKATEKHLGLLKAKIAKLKRSLIISGSKGGGGGGGFFVSKSGNATVALIGFPSTGKSTLLTKLTNAESKTAAYAFTTLSVIPGMLSYKGAQIQILDLPGIIAGAKEGKGRGREIIAVARTSDLILIILDAINPVAQFNAIKDELYGMGIRINSKPKNVFVEKREKGGIEVLKTAKISLSKETIEGILWEYGIHNAYLTARENFTDDELIDHLEGNRVYPKALVAMNKSDLLTEKQIEKLKAELGHEAIFVSAEKNKNLELLKEKIHSKLDFMQVFTKPQDGEVDKEPLILKRKSTIEEFCRAIHKDLYKNFRFAIVWGTSAKFPGQKVGLNHVLHEKDIVTIVAKKI